MKKVHLIGIGGISMRGLAEYLRDVGHVVSGCDLHPPGLKGIQSVAGHDPAHVADCDLVIYTSAVAPDSPAGRELTAARVRGIKIQKRAEAIGAITRERPTVTVSGMHGKSTTTGMIAEILTAAARDPLVMVGAPLPAAKGGTFRSGAGAFVLEADEFDRSFHNFHPDIAVLTNIEAEHLDYYTGGLPEILESFAIFLVNMKPGGTIIANGDDENLAKVFEIKNQKSKIKIIRYGRGENNDYRILESHLGPGSNSFTLASPYLLAPTPYTLVIPGRHNQMNATAAIAAADQLGIDRSVTAETLAKFPGVGHRFEVVAERDGAVFVADYAHHPTEVAATLAAARAWYPDRRLVAVLQPHQYARTKTHFAEFVAALSAADRVLVTDIFAVAGRERAASVTGAELAQATICADGDVAAYAPVGELLATTRASARPHDVVLLMGAGRDIAQVAQAFRERLA